jgi:outer membrane protein
MGGEYQSKEYVRYYYGLSSQESASSKVASYQPSGSFNRFVGLIADIGLSDEYHLNCQIRRKWLGNAIQSSPLVNQGNLDTGYISVSYRYK